MNKIIFIILNLRKEWKKKGFTPYEINNGNCDVFADEVNKLLPRAKVIETDYFNIDEYAHFYIQYKGMFFDAECPHGVKDYHELPLFKREKIK